ncbi:MAG: hypothetical protein JWR14_1714 [Caballeronia sp.]|jgi:hypothetical protein|nr:hypothetical protein [Caballeronia sp.]
MSARRGSGIAIQSKARFACLDFFYGVRAAHLRKFVKCYFV